MTKRITANLLRSKGACADHVAIFEKQWPNGIVPTKRQIPVIVRLGLDVDWAACNLLGAPAFKAYHEAIATALEAYKEAIAPALKEFEQVIAPLWYGYDEAIEPALKEYEEERAAAFIKAWREG